MGIIDSLMNSASSANSKSVEKEVEKLLAADEKIHHSFKLVRDLFIFTDRRLLLIDKQGMTGKKSEFHSIPYRSISHFLVETAGHFEIESELKIWISGSQEPIFDRPFRKDSSIIEIQKTLAIYCK